MFLSELTVSAHNSHGRLALSSPNLLHQLLCRGFPSDKRPRLLFRAEHSTPKVLMLSDTEPHYEHDMENGRLLNVRSKPFDPRVQVDQLLRFRLFCNPTRKLRGGARVALDPTARDAWIERKAENHGFRPITAQVARAENVVAPRPGAAPMVFAAVDLHGLLEVKDVNAFEHALRTGIGSGKAFGFGLLCVSR